MLDEIEECINKYNIAAFYTFPALLKLTFLLIIDVWNNFLIFQ